MLLYRTGLTLSETELHKESPEPTNPTNLTLKVLARNFKRGPPKPP